MTQRLVLLLAVCGLVLSGSSPAIGQALSVGDLTWTLTGTPGGPSEAGAQALQLVGPEGGCFGGQAAFETTAPFDGTVTAQLNFSQLDSACLYDWPLVAVDGVPVTLPSQAGPGCWVSQPLDVSVPVLRGQTLAFGVVSADCTEGPGLLDVSQFQLLPAAPWSDLGQGLDPRLVQSLAGPAAAVPVAALAAVDDRDQDGLAELALLSAGPAALSLRGGADGQPLWTVVLSVLGDEPAPRLVSPGDLDGDGLADLVACAAQVARAVALSGADGSTLWTWQGGAGSGYGGALAALGDQDGDGVADLAVAAPAADDAPVLRLSGVDGGALPPVAPLPVDQHVGLALAAAPDRDGDGRPDLLMTVEDAFQRRSVRWVGSGDGATLLEVDAPGWPWFQDHDDYGAVLAVGDDRDGDGLGELLVADPAARPGLALGRTGAVIVHAASDGAVLDVLQGSRDGEGFGASLAVGPDVDGDGLAETLVGAPGHGPPLATPGGRLTLHAGGDGALLQQWRGDPGQALGDRVAVLGDDLLAVAAPGATATAGQVLLLDDLDHPAGDRPTALVFGAPAPDQLLRLALVDGRPSAAAVLLLGAGLVQAPFKGGTLVPAPDVVLWLTLDAEGRLQLQAPWPPGLPAADELAAQVWVLDPAGPLGLAASTGLAWP